METKVKSLKSLAHLSKIEQTERQVIGILGDYADDFELSASNLEGERLVIVDAKTADGTVERFWCSRNVSKDIREGLLTTDDIFALPFAERTTTDGQHSYYQLQRNTMENNRKSFHKPATVVTPKARVFDWEQFIALGK